MLVQPLEPPFEHTTSMNLGLKGNCPLDQAELASAGNEVYAGSPCLRCLKVPSTNIVARSFCTQRTGSVHRKDQGVRGAERFEGLSCHAEPGAHGARGTGNLARAGAYELWFSFSI